MSTPEPPTIDLFTDGHASHSFKNRIEVKFREGSGLRARLGSFAVDGADAPGRATAQEIAAVSQILQGARRHMAVRMHEQSESTGTTARRSSDSGGIFPLIFRDVTLDWKLGTWNPNTGMVAAKPVDGSATHYLGHWGLPGDIPRYAHTNSGGVVDEFIVYRPSNGTWHNKRTNSTIAFGEVGDIAMAR